MKNLILCIACGLLFAACQKQMEIPEELVENPQVANLLKQKPFVITKDFNHSSPMLYNRVVPGSFPAVTQTYAQLSIDRSALKAKDYEAITGAKLRLKVAQGKGEEFSMPAGGTIVLNLEKFDRTTGTMTFAAAKTAFSFVWPELSYTTDATIELTLTYRDEKPAGKSGKLVPAKTEMVMQTIPNLPLNLKRNGKPFLVSISRAKDGQTFPFVMYAASTKEIAVYLNSLSEIQKGLGKYTIAALDKIPEGVEEINPVFNVNNLALVQISSPSIVIGFPFDQDEPWLGFDPAYAADGKGTRTTTSTAQSQPKLL